jgi:hypothetical protein
VLSRCTEAIAGVLPALVGPVAGVVRGGVGGGELLRGDESPEGRHFDRLGAEPDMGQAESPPDDPAIPEQALDLIGMRRRADIEVLGASAEQQIANAAAHEVGDVLVLMEAVQHLERVRIDLAARDRVLGSRHDNRFHHGRIVTNGIAAAGRSKRT